MSHCRQVAPAQLLVLQFPPEATRATQVPPVLHQKLARQSPSLAHVVLHAVALAQPKLPPHEVAPLHEVPLHEAPVIEPLVQLGLQGAQAAPQNETVLQALHVIDAFDGQ